jgi:hypothetical protein
MTIAAAYLTSEGVVLGADSATTVSVKPPGQPASVMQVLTHAQKLFEVGEKDQGRFGVCTWGSGTVAGVSHRTIVARLADNLTDETDVKNAAEALIEVVKEAANASGGGCGDVGYFIGGTNIGGHVPECFQVNIPASGDPTMKQLEIGQGMFSGAPAFFTRAFRGYDQALPGRIADELKRRLEPVPDGFDKMFGEAFAEASKPLVAAGLGDLPIREAIDYVHTYLHITVKAYKFMFGVPVCGGPIEVAFVTTDRRFRWVCHKSFDSAVREEEVFYDEG